MKETETETETGAVTRALARQLYYLRAIFVLGMAVAVLVVTIAVTPTDAGTVTVVGTATTMATTATACTSPLLCTITGSGGDTTTGTIVPSGTGGTGMHNDGLGGGWVLVPACTAPLLCTIGGTGGAGGTDPGAR